MKILVVGGAGYVGGGIVDTLSKKNEITVYDSLIYESAFRKDVNFKQIMQFAPQSELSFEDFDECDSGFCGL